MVPERNEEEVLERDVVGQYNTFRVYIHMMKVKEATAREVYRALGMSSPSLALLHLDKLVNLGLAEKDYGTYYISTMTKRIGMLKFFYLIRKWFVPRAFFYFLFFASMMVVFLYLSFESQNYIVPAAVALLSALVNLYETLSFYRLLH